METVRGYSGRGHGDPSTIYLSVTVLNYGIEVTKEAELYFSQS